MLIYSQSNSTRLQYVCRFIFQEQMGIDYGLTTDAAHFENYDGPRINYSQLPIPGDIFSLKNHSLLFESGIRKQEITIFENEGQKAFFCLPGSNFAFDIFAATFYLLSRYEEYLPHEKDIYGRYAHQNSLAFEEDFLNKPLVNLWLFDFAKCLVQKFPNLKIQWSAFKFTPTYDIDIAWSYKSKGLVRNIGGFLKAPSLLRLAVLVGLQKDPFDSYAFLHRLHEEFRLNPIYFFLVATSPGSYDKNISPYNHRMWSLMKRHAKKYDVGLHPSWKSNVKKSLLSREKKILETAGDRTITKSRQHYIKIFMPQTFERLQSAGIFNDYSMGYGSINGFRASVASSFLWYNLSEEKTTSLRLHPFCFMDANSFYEQGQNATESLDELLYYYRSCKGVHGEFISIFHNHFLGTDPLFEGWKEMYEQFISQIQQ